MYTGKDLRLGRFLKKLLDFLYGALVTICVLLVLWSVLAPVIIRQTHITAAASVPVQLGSGDGSRLEVLINNSADDGVQASFIEEAKGTLQLETASFYFILIANAAKLVVGVGLAYVFNLLRKILQNILDGDPFAAENGQRIRRLGNAVLILAFIRPISEYIATAEILKRLAPTSPALMPGAQVNVETILISLLILLLSYVWNYGLELERDKALTV